MQKKVFNPERPYGSDIEGNFVGHNVVLPADSFIEVSEHIAEALRERYPWLSIREVEEQEVAPEVPAEEAPAEVPAEPAEEVPADVPAEEVPVVAEEAQEEILAAAAPEEAEAPKARRSGRTARKAE